MDDNKHLRLIKEGDSHLISTKKSLSEEEFSYVLSDRVKIVILFFIMGVIPLSAYQFGADTWGMRIGTHIAVGVSAVCTVVTSLLIYILGWMDGPEEV